MYRILTQTSCKQLQRFLGMINFYQDIFRRRSHILAPLNNLTAPTARKKGVKSIHFEKQHHHINAFNTAKVMIKTEAKSSFPDFTKTFHLYTGTSDIQLDARLVQDGKSFGFYSRKLNNTQLNYTVGEKELLGIVEGLKAFAGVIRGQDLTVHIDHLNVLYNKPLS